MTLVIPESARPTIKFLYEEVVGLHLHWKVFTDLFGYSEERIDLLNAAAPSFFWHIEHAVLHSTVSGIARLLDRPKGGGQENLTLQSLIDALPGEEFEALRVKLAIRLVDARKLAAPIIRFRHKRVGHRDKAVALGEIELDGFSRTTFREVLAEIAAYMNEVHTLPPEETTVMYADSFSDGDAESLVARLRDGLVLKQMYFDEEISRELVREKRKAY